MEEFNQYREFIIDQISYAFTKIINNHSVVEQMINGEINNAYYNILIGLIEAYPKVVDGKNLYGKESTWRDYCYFSYDAFEITKRQGASKDLATLIHGEHNPPKGRVYKKIKNELVNEILKNELIYNEAKYTIIKNIVREIIKNEKYDFVVITKEEKLALDSKADEKLFLIHGTKIQGRNLIHKGCFDCRLKSIDVILKTHAEWKAEVRKQGNKIQKYHSDITPTDTLDNFDLCYKCKKFHEWENYPSDVAP